MIGIPFLFYFDNHSTALSTFSVLLFSFGLLFVYTSSSIYHYVQNAKLKKRFQVLDHISIYYLILGSYAPVCLITLYDSSGINIFLAVLVLAFVGTLKKLFFTGKFEFISLLLYLAMGWFIIFDIHSLFELIDYNAKLLLILVSKSLVKFFHLENPCALTLVDAKACQRSVCIKSNIALNTTWCNDGRRCNTHKTTWRKI